MEGAMQVSLGDRLRVAGRAIRGLFKQPAPQDLLGVYAGLFPRRSGERRQTHERKASPKRSLSLERYSFARLCYSHRVTPFFSMEDLI
jgi:hypothetical protein